MAVGWNTGYFGIQEISADRKVVIFSVWDPTKGDDAKAVPDEQRVEVLHQDRDVRIKRFGGEGTGGQCMWDYAWRDGANYRFVLHATVEGEKTAYAAYFYLPEEKRWKHLATFRTLTKGSPLKGYYSFVEDFRRNGKSVEQTRRARFANGWVRSLDNVWIPFKQARFTASKAVGNQRIILMPASRKMAFTLPPAAISAAKRPFVRCSNRAARPENHRAICRNSSGCQK